ncbi:MAG: DNA-protecting protein DprA [Spirochaetales bacterium]|nr:DNA-protecting protein DprA [Spirochaetales bacterium]
MKFLEKDLLRSAIARHGGLKCHERRMLTVKFETVDSLKRSSQREVEVWLGRPLAKEWLPEEALQKAERDLKNAERVQAWLWHEDASDFPAALKAICDPPFLLWGRGCKPPLDRSWVAVVGTRSPSEQGKRAAFSLGKDFASLGVVVVSGLARGIDAQAHRGVVEGRGKTVAVLGQGIDWVFPSSNTLLAHRLLENDGAILSEYPPGTPARAYHFPARNRLVSGLCRSLIVVEAPSHSGALITVDFSLDQGRDVMVHRVGLTSSRGDGGRRLVEEGAPVIENGHQVVQMWKDGSIGLGDRQLSLL